LFEIKSFNSKVSEKITAALSSVKCPIILNPVQLQGLDLDTIYQVLQWLVKKLIETRDERNIKNKITAISYYNSILNSIVEKKAINKNENVYRKLIIYQFLCLGILNNFYQIKPIININEKINLITDKNKDFIFSNDENDTINKIKEIKIKQEKNLEAKYNLLNKERVFRPSNSYNFSYNDSLRIYFNLIEYGMNREISFQKNLIELLKKKGLVDDTKYSKIDYIEK